MTMCDFFEKIDLTVPVNIYTDGACKGNPGPGGWGVYVFQGDQECEFMGGDPSTTNNRMEMMAAIMALKSIPEGVGCMRIVLHTDSTYLKMGITQWIHQWIKNNWKTSDRRDVKNQDLWRSLHELIKGKTIEWVWVRGHSGHFGNEKADALARQAIIAQKMYL